MTVAKIWDPDLGQWVKVVGSQGPVGPTGPQENPGAPGTTPSGTSFPGSPATLDRFLRTDILGGTVFFWDGTNWLSEQQFAMELGIVDAVSVTATVVGRVALPQPYAAYLTGLSLVAFVSAPNNGSNYWTLVTESQTAGGSPTARGSGATSGATAATFAAIASADFVPVLLLTTATTFVLVVNKTGTPGNVTARAVVTYRLRAT